VNHNVERKMVKSISGLFEGMFQIPGKGHKRGGILCCLMYPPTFEDEAKNRVASLQHKIILAMFLIDLLAFITLLLPWANHESLPDLVLLLLPELGHTLFGMISLTLIFVLLRFGYIEYVSWLMVGNVYLAFIVTYLTFGSIYTNAILLILVIALASLFLRPLAVGIVSAIATLSPLVLHLIAPPFAVEQNEIVFIPLTVGLAGLLLTISAHN
jgi:hypothetical protein